MLAEVEQRRKLDLVLPLILQPADAMVRMTTLRRLLVFCGLYPTVTYLTEALAKLGTYVETVRVRDSRRLALPGVRVADGCIPRAREALLRDWNERLRGEGLGEALTEAPKWIDNARHFDGDSSEESERATAGWHATRSRDVVFPSDWEEEGTPERTLRRKAFQAAAAAAAAGEYHAKMADYLWRGCDWRNYAASDRLILELHIVDGLDAADIGRKIGRTREACKAVLQRHRALAGIVPRGRQVKR